MGHWITRGLVVLLASLQAGWFVIDGGRALIVGEYFTVRKGRNAGNLGLWADLMRWAGFEPHSVPVKLFFVLYGLIWFSVIVYYVRKQGCQGSTPLMALAAIGSLWYIGPGTALVFTELLLLSLLPRRTPTA